MKLPYFLALFAYAVLSNSLSRADEMTDDFAWFSSLEYPDVKGVQPVHFTDHWFTTSGPTEAQPRWGEGFLLNTSAKGFQVLKMNFSKEDVSWTDEYAHKINYFEPADLSTDITARLNSEKEQKPYVLYTPYPNFPRRTELFVIAWMCSRQGLDDAASKLYRLAQEPPSAPLYGPDNDTNLPFREKLERDLGEFELWRIMLDFGDPNVSRPQLLQKLRNLEKNFPHCTYIPRVKETAAMLEQMIAEDSAHRNLSDEEIARLPEQEQVKEWIFRLRDQNGHQRSQPGWVEVFLCKETSPAHHLASLGDAAVPQLIEALGDKRLTRSVGYGRNFFFSHHVLSIGDTALEIIQRIADREFYRSGRVQGSMAQDGKTDLIRAAVKDWWEVHKTKGEKGEMADSTASGGYNAPEIGAKLLKKYPDAAANALYAGASAAKNWKTRSDLLNLVAKLKDEQVAPFLLNEVKTGPSVGSRAQAGYELAKLGNLDGIPLLAQEWLEKPHVSNTDERAPREKLLIALSLANSPVGIQALSSGLTKRTLFTRQRLFEILMSPSDGPFRDSAESYRRFSSLSDSTRQALEALLAGELEDTGEAVKQLKPNLRLCDGAAYCLSLRWPDRYQFEPAAPLPLRERQRILCLNSWRKQRSLEPLSLNPAVEF